MNEQIRFVLIGCGQLGSQLVDKFAPFSETVITACCDKNAEQAESFASHHAIPRTYTGYRRMLAEEHPNGILNATPDAVHDDVIAAALEFSCPILTPPPFSNGYYEANQARGKLHNAHVPCLVNFDRREQRGVEAARILLSQNDENPFLRMHMSYRQGWIQEVDGHAPHLMWRRNSSMSPLGALGELGIPLADMLHYVTGKRITQVSGAALFQAPQCEQICSPDGAQATLICQDGTPINFIISRLDTGRKDSFRMDVYTEKFALEMNLFADSKAVQVAAHDSMSLPVGLYDPETGEALRRLRGGEVRRITATAPIPITSQFLALTRPGGHYRGNPNVQDAVEAHRLIDAILESAQENGATTVLESKNPGAGIVRPSLSPASSPSPPPQQKKSTVPKIHQNR